MLLAFPGVGSSSEQAAQARFDIYEDSLADLPPWAINNAIKRWAKGEVPADMAGSNFAFAPAPATLRKLVKVELLPFETQADKLMRLLRTVSIERAMDPTPLPPAEVKSPSGKVVSIGMKRV